MERVLIIGCGGAGKSTLAKALGEKTGLPVVHLDKIFWSPGNWQHLPREEFDRILITELDKPQWILDGNYDRTFSLRLAKCDTVIYLDFSRLTCLLGWIKRVITNWGKTRPDMGPNCNEWFDPEMLGWIWNYNKQSRKKNYRMLEEATHARVIVLRNRKMVKSFLEGI